MSSSHLVLRLGLSVLVAVALELLLGRVGIMAEQAVLAVPARALLVEHAALARAVAMPSRSDGRQNRREGLRWLRGFLLRVGAAGVATCRPATNCDRRMFFYCEIKIFATKLNFANKF